MAIRLANRRSIDRFVDVISYEQESKELFLQVTGLNERVWDHYERQFVENKRLQGHPGVICRNMADRDARLEGQKYLLERLSYVMDACSQHLYRS